MFTSTNPLPFSVRIVTTPDELMAAVEVRADAYERHNAPGADQLRVPESDDLREEVIVLIARRKLDGRAIGTIRVQPNVLAPMKFEASAPLPAAMRGRSGVELMRLGVAKGKVGMMVTAALAKASYQICRNCSIDYIFVAGRRPVDAIYRAYQFDDLLDGKTVALSYAPGAQHSILCLPTAQAEERWRTHNDALHTFMVATEHPDIDIDYSAVRSRLSKRT